MFLQMIINIITVINCKFTIIKIKSLDIDLDQLSKYYIDKLLEVSIYAIGWSSFLFVFLEAYLEKLFAVDA
jgi:hypothetical protein